MDQLNRDELLTIAYKLDLNELLTLCKTNRRLYQKIWCQTEIWTYWLNYHFPSCRKYKSTPREIFLLEMQLNTIRKAFRIPLDYLAPAITLQYRRIWELPKAIGCLTNLKSLQLNDNRISVIPKEIGRLTNLHELILTRNKIQSLPAEIGQLSNLRVLGLRYNQIKTLPSEIGQLSRLKVLGLSNNCLTELPTTIGNLTSLQKLLVYENDLAELPPEIGQLTDLRVLSIKGNLIKKLPREVTNLTKLKHKGKKVSWYESYIYWWYGEEENRFLKLSKALL